MKLISRFLVSGLAVLTLAACAGLSHHHHDHHDHHHHEAEARLLVHSDDGSVHILDAEDGDILAEWRGMLDPGSAFVHVSASGEFGFVTHRQNWLSLVIDSGFELEEHGDHYDLHVHSPRLLGELRTGAKPSHYYSAGDRSIFYNDDDGSISLFDEKSLRSSLAFTSFKARVDHGAPIISGDAIIVGYLNAPVIDIFNLDGSLRQSLPTGSRLHGEARIGRFTAFGLVEGLALVVWDGRTHSAKILPKPQAIAGDARINHVRSHILVPHFIGRTNTGNYLAVIDPVSEAWTVRQLPAAFSQFHFDASGRYFAVLDNTGTLHSIDPYSLDILASLAVTTPLEGGPAPVMAMAKATAWITDPSTNSILRVCLEHMEVEAVFSLPGPGRVSGLGFMQTAGVVH